MERNQESNALSNQNVLKSSNTKHNSTYFNVTQFSERNQAFSESALRNLIFKAAARKSSLGEIEGNGLIESGALVRLGRKVLINEEKFFNWIECQNRYKGE